MSKMKISEYFNPEQHLTLHQDKEGNMIGGGYQVNNLLYQRKMPLFVSLGNSGGGQGAMSGGAGAWAGGGTGSDDCENRHFIPEKFSDLFRDLAVPAGLFMMPPQFRPRNYAFDVPEEDATIPREKKHGDGDGNGNGESSSSSDSSDDEGSESNRRTTVPTDIFDTLLALVTPTERIQHDVKTRRQRQKTQQQQQHSNKADKKRQNKTRRAARDE